MLGLTLRVICLPLLVGSLAFAAGLFWADLYSPTSNLGPLLGLFITGPVGTLVGAIWGIVSLAKNANWFALRAMLALLSAVWVLTMLYTHFTITICTQWAYPAIGLQGLIVASSAFLLYRADTRTRLPQSVKRCGPVAITAIAFIMLMTVFPPITRPWWGPKAGIESADSTAPLPKVAFILDQRFDASRHVPLFAVDRRTLVLEWLVSLIVALGVSLVIIRARSRSRPDTLAKNNGKPISRNKIFLIATILVILLPLLTISFVYYERYKDAKAYFNRGLAYYDKGQYDQAISEYSKALEINPRYALAYNDRGNAYQSKGQNGQAISDYSKAIELNPKDHKAYNNRGIAYSREGRKEWETTLTLDTLDPEHIKTKLESGLVIYFDQAISDFTKGIEVNPKVADHYNNRGLIYYYKREWDKAWKDVHMAQSLGYQVHPGFLKALREDSGRQR